MIQFILGVLVGGVVGFAVCAICSIAGTDDRAKAACDKETGDNKDDNK